MNQFLRSLTAEQQVSALFIIVFGVLFITSATVFILSLRERGDTVQAEVNTAVRAATVRYALERLLGWLRG